MGPQGIPGPQGYSGDEVSEVLIIIGLHVYCQSVLLVTQFYGRI